MCFTLSLSLSLSLSLCVCHSLGGYLSSTYAISYPQHVAGLILVSPVGIPSNGIAELHRNRHETASSSGSTVASAPRRGPPPIPAWLIPVLRRGWNSGITPGVLLRGMGPLGPCCARRSTLARASRMTLEIPLSPQQLALIGGYFYHSNAADGSGEFTLRHLLAPGAYAINPIGQRLIDAAQRPPSDLQRMTCRVVFIYGSTHDWMSAEAGDVVASALVAAGLPSYVRRVGPGGHHLYLEACSAFNAVVCAEVAAVFCSDKSVPTVNIPSSCYDVASLASSDSRIGVTLLEAPAVIEPHLSKQIVSE